MKLSKSGMWFFSPCPDQVELDGVRVPLKNSPLDPKTRRRLMRGSYELPECDLVRTFIKPGEQVLELGASVGIVTCFLGRQAGSTGRLVCVEADARLKAPFETQLAVNGVRAVWVNALCCPLWQDQVPAHIAKMSFQQSERTLSGRAVAGPAGGEGAPWLTALAICRETKLEPTALVVDIEGSEGVWSEYPPNLPDSIGLVIAEFHPGLLGSTITGQAVQAILEQGFVVAALRQNVLAFKRR
jgi:FkbM family methyltransferase